MLSVLDGRPRVINALVAFALLSMHTKLHLVNAVAEAEDGHVGALHSRHDLISLAIVLLTLVKCGNRHKVSELLCRLEVSESDSLVHLMIEGYAVECLFEVPADQLIVHEGFPRQEIEVLLKAFTDEMVIKVAEELCLALLQLALQKGKHAPRDANERVVLLIIKVLLRDKRHNRLDRIQVVLVLETILGVTGDVYAIQFAKLFLQLQIRHRVVNRHNASATSLQEFGMRGLEVALESQIKVIVPLARQGLRQDTNDWLVVLCTCMMALVLQNFLSLMAAKMRQTLTFYT